MSIAAQHHDETVVTERIESAVSMRQRVFVTILDQDYEAIESDLFGSRAIDCLPLTSESAAAPPQGSPFLGLARPISTILHRFKGVYSI